MAERRYSATKYPIRLVAGSDFSQGFNYYPEGLDQAAQNWSGWTGEAQVRKTASTSEVLLDFTVTLGAEGSVVLSAESADTDELPAGKFVYDVRVEDGSGHDKVLFAGSCTIAAAVTR